MKLHESVSSFIDVSPFCVKEKQCDLVVRVSLVSIERLVFNGNTKSNHSYILSKFEAFFFVNINEMNLHLLGNVVSQTE